MIDLLSAKLDTGSGFRTVDPLVVLHRLRAAGGAADPESARLIAAGLQAGHFVLGAIVGTGDRLHAAATVYRTNGGEEVRGAVECRRDAGPAAFVDDLARQLLVGLGGAAGGPVTPVATSATDSLPALKAFLEGREARRHGRYEAARDAFARAVAADPDFALGHARLAGMLDACGEPADARAACAAARRLRDRLRERDRLLLDAQVAWFDGDASTAEVLCWRVIAEAPDDVEAWFQLGDIQFDANPYRGRSCAEARAAFERVLELDADHAGALIHLARIEALERRDDALEHLAGRIETMSPGSDAALAARAMSAFTRSDRVAQAALLAALVGRRLRSIARVASDVVLYAVGVDALGGVAGAMLRLAPGGALGALQRIVGALVAAAGGAWRDAERELDRLDHPAALMYRALLATLPTRATDRTALEDMRNRLDAWRPAAATPQPNSALAVLDEAQALLRQYLLGLTHAWLGEAPLADAAATACAALEGPSSAPLLPRQLAAGIRARLALVRGDAQAALQTLQGMRCPGWPELVIWSPFHGHAAERLALAQAAAALGRPEDAAAWAGGLAQRSPTEVVFRAEARRLQLIP
jgi:thioredoxin-like negative regulator of GroEL